MIQIKHNKVRIPTGGRLPVGYLQGVEELNSGPPKTNPPSGREEDLNPGPPDYKSSALPIGHARLLHIIIIIIIVKAYKASPDVTPHDVISKEDWFFSNCCCFCLCTVVGGSLLASPFARLEVQEFVDSYINKTYGE